MSAERLRRRTVYAIRPLPPPGAAPDDWELVDVDDATALWALVNGHLGEAGTGRVEIRALPLFEAIPVDPPGAA